MASISLTFTNGHAEADEIGQALGDIFLGGLYSANCIGIWGDMEEWPAVTPPIHFGAKPMLARAQRKELFSSYAGRRIA